MTKLYEYVCKGCGEHHLSTRHLDMNKKKDTKCYHCGKSALRRVWSSIPFIMR